MKLSKSFTKITPFSKALALTILIVFPIIGFWLGMKYNEAKKLNIEVSNIKAGWKVYKNEQLGLSFEYPNSWESPQVKELNDRIQIYFESDNFEVDLISNQTFDEVIKNNLATDGSLPEDVIIDGIKGKRFDYKIGASAFRVLYVFNKPIQTITVSYYTNQGDINDTGDQILSTFKFTN